MFNSKRVISVINTICFCPCKHYIYFFNFKVLESRIKESNPFYSIIGEGKMMLLRYLCFSLNKGRFDGFLGLRFLLLVGVIFKRFEGVSFLRVLQKKNTFLYTVILILEIYGQLFGHLFSRRPYFS